MFAALPVGRSCIGPICHHCSELRGPLHIKFFLPETLTSSFAQQLHRLLARRCETLISPKHFERLMLDHLQHFSVHFIHVVHPPLPLPLLLRVSHCQCSSVSCAVVSAGEVGLFVLFHIKTNRVHERLMKCILVCYLMPLDIVVIIIIISCLIG